MAIFLLAIVFVAYARLKAVTGVWLSAYCCEYVSS